MTEENRKIPRTQPSAPVKPARTPTDAPERGEDRDAEAPSKRHHVSDESDAGGDQMPKGFNEPGAGI
jgi:hypothetical protein